MSFFEMLDDADIEPNLEIMVAIVGREEAERQLEAWRLASLERRVGLGDDNK